MLISCSKQSYSFPHILFPLKPDAFSNALLSFKNFSLSLPLADLYFKVNPRLRKKYHSFRKTSQPIPNQFELDSFIYVGGAKKPILIIYWDVLEWVLA
jgi:hypothetical protein